MKDIELIIKISEEIYNHTQEYEVGGFNQENDTKLFMAIKNGKPLPKGHGRLGDLDIIKKEMQNYHDDCAKTSKYTRLGFETAMAVVEDAHTIIPTDTESEDKECR